MNDNLCVQANFALKGYSCIEEFVVALEARGFDVEIFPPTTGGQCFTFRIRELSDDEIIERELLHGTR